MERTCNKSETALTLAIDMKKHLLTQWYTTNLLYSYLGIFYAIFYTLSWLQKILVNIVWEITTSEFNGVLLRYIVSSSAFVWSLHSTISSENNLHNIKRPDYTCDFLLRFGVGLWCNFYRRPDCDFKLLVYKLPAISLRFGLPSSVSCAIQAAIFDVILSAILSTDLKTAGHLSLVCFPYFDSSMLFFFQVKRRLGLA